MSNKVYGSLMFLVFWFLMMFDLAIVLDVAGVISLPGGNRIVSSSSEDAAGQETLEGWEPLKQETPIEEGAVAPENPKLQWVENTLRDAEKEYNARNYNSARSMYEDCKIILESIENTDVDRQIYESVYSRVAFFYMQDGKYKQAAGVLNDGLELIDSDILKFQKECIRELVCMAYCAQKDSSGHIMNVTTLSGDDPLEGVCDFYDSEGKVYESHLLHYDYFRQDIGDTNIAFRKLRMEECYDDAGNYLWKKIYAYDDAERVLCRVMEEYDKNNSLVVKEKYSYDDTYRLKQIKHYSKDGILEWKEKFDNTDSGNVTSVIENENGDVLSNRFYTYDPYGNETAYTEYDMEGNHLSEWQKSYNEWGDVERFIMDGQEYTYEYQYGYDYIF